MNKTHLSFDSRERAANFEYQLNMPRQSNNKLRGRLNPNEIYRAKVRGGVYAD